MSSTPSRPCRPWAWEMVALKAMQLHSANCGRFRCRRIHVRRKSWRRKPLRRWRHMCQGLFAFALSFELFLLWMLLPRSRLGPVLSRTLRALSWGPATCIACFLCSSMGLMDIGIVVAMGPVAIASTALPNRAFHHPHAKATAPWIGLVLHDGTNCSNTRQKLHVPGVVLIQ